MEILHTLEEVTQNLKVSKITLYRYIKSGKLKAYKLGKEMRISDNEYKEFLKRMQFNPSQKQYDTNT